MQVFHDFDHHLLIFNFVLTLKNNSFCMHFIFGLGNPGEEYRDSRHNTGRMALLKFAKMLNFPEFEFQKKANALVSVGKVGKEKVTLVLPETFMNKSGISASFFVKSKKTAVQMVVVYDEIDLALGTLKIVWNRGFGGHKGLESVARAVKTKEFTRVRIGISPKKKPSGEKIIDFILGSFKPSEEQLLKKSLRTAAEAIRCIFEEGREKAMNTYN
jgi:PTH1 family peptidyl-tRNA hydrolase